MEGPEVDGEPPRRLPFDGLIAEVLRDAASAARGEAKAEAQRSNDRMALRAGHTVGSVGSDHVWSFSVVGDDDPPPETPGDLLIDDQPPIACRVLATGTGTLLLSVRADLGRSVPRATLVASAGFVHLRLAERLEGLAVEGTDDPTLVEALVHPEPDPGEPGPIPFVDDEDDQDDGAEDEQEVAVRRAVEPGLRFTWGPPGTGKTGVLARAVAMAAEEGQRVLVVAHANAAVDVAAARIADELDGSEILSAGRVLRVGTPHRPEAIDRHEVLPERIVADRHPDLADRRLALEHERRGLSDAAREAGGPGPDGVATRLAAIRGELADLRSEVADAQRELIHGAAVLVTTLAKVVIDDDVWRWPADVVVVDEASMAPYPAVLALAARGATTLSCVGDFRQLPPVAISTDAGVRHWFAQDVFTHAAVTATHESGGRDQRLAVLHTQHRMGELICATIGDLAYDGALVTAPTARNRAIRLAERWPGEGAEIVAVDTSGLGATCERPAAADDRSRFGPLSAALAVAVAETHAGRGDEVGLVSPYRAHVDLLHSATRARPSIATGTIHRFQGSERDIVVLDLVDAPGGDGASVLTGSDRDLSRRLINVAASRARGKLVVLAHLAFLGAEHPPMSASRRLVELAADHGAETMDAVDVVADLPGVAEPIIRWFPDQGAALRTVLVRRDAPRVEVHAGTVGVADRWCDAVKAVDPDVDVVRASGPSSPSARPRPGIAVIDDVALVVASEAGPTAVVTSPATVTTYRRLATPA